MVQFDQHSDAITVQIALDGQLAVPFTVSPEVFWGEFPDEISRHAFLARNARTLLDIYGDARHDRRLSDQEVSQRAAA
jgi:hypothetical protein